MNNNRQIEDIPVVMISAENGIEHIERAYDLGVTDYILSLIHIFKPVEAADMRRAVERALKLAMGEDAKPVEDGVAAVSYTHLLSGRQSFSAPAERGTRTAAGVFAPDGREVFR